MLPWRTLQPVLRQLLSLPEPALRAIAGPPRRSDTGAELDLQTQALLRLQRLVGRGLTWKETTAERARWETEIDTLLGNLAPSAMERVDERTIPTRSGSRPARVYVPRPGGDLPVLVWFHGGGWVVGSLTSHDPVCRILADKGECLVVAVDYRLAPEHRFPAGVEDALDSYRWVREHARELGGDPGRVAIGGDSAGGNLAAVAARWATHEGIAPTLQALVYPATDLTRSSKSHRTLARGYLLEAQTIEWFLRRYLRSPDQETDPDASPLFAEDLQGLPPAVVATGGFDPLRDEGRAYVARLREAGVQVTHLAYPGLVHGFMNMAGLVDAARRAAFEIAEVTGARLRAVPAC